MTDDPAVLRSWRLAPAVLIAAVGAIALPVAGVVLARPDIAAAGLPLGLWTALAVTVRPAPRGALVRIESSPDGEEGWLHDEVHVDAGAEMVEVALVQSGRSRRRAFVAGGARLLARSRVLHSGPVRTVEAEARSIAADGGMLAAPAGPVGATRAVQPVPVRLGRLPLAPRLTGLHGGHEGSRPGQGGDFRDIHPFAPGDELRRVDWKATARAARRPGELLVRRTNALSDASIVIAMDTADDLGAVVATWGTTDLERSGVTSLDHARSAARSLASATVADGDRVAFHTLVHGGRSVRSGAGRRHLARIVAEISASGRGGDDARFRRTPPVPQGSVVYVLSTFFDGAAAAIALQWRAVGHRVIAIDTLPELITRHLSPERDIALRVLLDEREDMMHELRSSGIDTVRWADDPASALAAIARPVRGVAGIGSRVRA